MILELMKKCETYVGEMNLGNVDPALILAAFTWPEGEQIADLISTVNYQRYQKILRKSFGIELSQVDHFAPIYIMSIITSQILNNDMPENLDYHLHRKALELDMKIDGLESPEQQFNIALSLDKGSQLKALQKACRNPKLLRKETNQLINNYKNGNIKLLYQKAKKSLAKNKNILLYNRNIEMTAKIKMLTQSSSCFISVGAGHLPGNKGILRYLKKEGYQVDCLL